MLRLSRNIYLSIGFATLMWVNGVVCVGVSNGQEPTRSTAEETGEIAGDVPLELDDQSAKKQVDEEPLGVDPDFIAAFKSLDESLKYEPEKPLRVRARLVTTAMFGGALLGLLAVLFGYLKLNHLTRGFYSGRLQTLAIGSSVLILALCYFLWTQVLFK